MKPIAVVTTVANREDAHRLARTLVERKLAACAQISEIESIYRWQGEVQQGWGRATPVARHVILFWTAGFQPAS